MAAIGHDEKQEFSYFIIGLPVELIFKCIYVETGFIEVIVVLYTI